jgi:hypothetical protein
MSCVGKRTAQLFTILLSSGILASSLSLETSEFGEFDSPIKGCKGRFYPPEAEYNRVERQEMWKIDDDLVEEGGYNALKIRVCHVFPTRACHVFSESRSSKMLITKFEFHPDNKGIVRSLDSFLSCMVVAPDLFNNGIIYAWVDESDKALLRILKSKYSFKESKRKFESSERNLLKIPKKTTQLKVKVEELGVEKNTWLENALNGNK